VRRFERLGTCSAVERSGQGSGPRSVSLTSSSTGSPVFGSSSPESPHVGVVQRARARSFRKRPVAPDRPELGSRVLMARAAELAVVRAIHLPSAGSSRERKRYDPYGGPPRSSGGESSARCPVPESWPALVFFVTRLPVRVQRRYRAPQSGRSPTPVAPRNPPPPTTRARSG